jgi:hypothetical protein
VHDPAYLVAEGEPFSESVNFAYRVSLTSTGNRFVASSFSSTSSGLHVKLHSFDGTSPIAPGVDLESLGLALPGVPVSALALTSDKTAVPPAVHGYVAIGADIGPTDTGRVFHVKLDENLQNAQATQTSASPNYGAVSAVRSPSAWKVAGGSVAGNWIGPLGEVFVHSPLATVKTLPNTSGVKIAAPGGGANATAGAFYVDATGLKVQLPGMNIPARSRTAIRNPRCRISALRASPPASRTSGLPPGRRTRPRAWSPSWSASPARLRSFAAVRAAGQPRG